MGAFGQVMDAEVRSVRVEAEEARRMAAEAQITAWFWRSGELAFW